MAKMSELRKAVEITEKFQDIPLENINEIGNVRTEYNGIDELAESIVMSGGLLQPIVVLKKDNDNYELIAGHRRLRAYKKLKNDNGVSYNTIPAIVKSSIESIPENQLIENIQRENLSDRDIEKAISFILEKDNISQSDLAKRLGKDKSWISKNMTALKTVETLEAAGVAPAQLSEMSTNTAAELSTIPPEKVKNIIDKNNGKLKRDDLRKVKSESKKLAPAQLSTDIETEPLNYNKAYYRLLTKIEKFIKSHPKIDGIKELKQDVENIKNIVR